MNTTRSPKFPVMPLKKAIELLRKISVFETDSEGPLTRPQLLKALDYASFHGAAIKAVGALRAYDLLSKNGDGVSISPLGRILLDTEATEEAKLDAMQRAALSPMAFRRIWRNARHARRDELRELLLSRNFTESGADRASKIYCRNSKLAGLETLDLEPVLPERGGKPAGEGERRVAMANRRRMQKKCAKNAPGANMLHLPLSTGKALIPTGISADEFQLLMKTLRTWESQIVKNGEG